MYGPDIDVGKQHQTKNKQKSAIELSTSHIDHFICRKQTPPNQPKSAVLVEV
jgi:hypothetical protein